MVPVDKFYVYGGGRWREVDPGSGRIDGWGRARFLVARGGKLEAARSRPVLAALRSLAEKKPSAANEGPPLPYKYPRFRSRERAHQGCEHQCCHHSSGSGCASKSNDKKASIAIQCNNVDLPSHKQSDNITNPTQNSTTNEKTFTFNQKKNSTTNEKISTTNSKTYNQKRKRDSTSSEELFYAKGVTVATVHSPRKPEAKRPRISSNTRNTRNESTSSNDTIIVKKSPRLQLRRTLKRKHSSSGESIIFESRMNRPKKKINESQLRRSARHNISIVISDDDDENTRKIQYKQRSDEPLRPKGLNSTDEPLRSKGQKRTENSTVKYGTTESSTDEQAKRNSKSLKDEQIKHMLKGKSKDKLKFQNSSSDESFNTIKQKPGTNEKILKKPSPKKSIDISSNDEPSKSLISPKQAKLKQGPRNDDKFDSIRSLRSQNKDNNTQSQNTTQDTSKELIIDEKDVDILRLFLEKNFPDEDLLRFDTDDEYKKMHFYRINPLVNVERCPRIDSMIRDSHDNRLSLVVFASKLGLRSVSEASSVKRYRTRRRDEKKNYEEVDIDKENERPSRTINVQKAVRKEREDTRERDTKDTALRKKEREDDRKERDNTNDTAVRRKKTEEDVKRKEREDMRERENTKATATRRKEREDDRKEKDNFKDTVVKRKVRENDSIERDNNKDTGVKRKERENTRERENTKDTAMRKKERKDDTALRMKEKEDDRKERENTKDSELSNDSGKVKGLKKKTKAVSKRPPLNEYSNLEDHAIVTWVSVGARSCCVNGNRIWRQLQEQFKRITGHERTWHSLRNRYLRYILPRLGSLALPPSLQTRLRAAAATGELKGKRRDAKRNSIFKPPTRGAASRRPGLTHQDTVIVEDSGHENNPAPSPLRPRTPRYSDVTRQFAREHRYSSESKSASENINNNNNKTSVRDTRTNAKNVLSVKSNGEHRNNSSKSRLQGKSRKSNESSEEQSDTDKNKSRIKIKHILSLRRKRSPSDSCQTDSSKSSDSITGDSDSRDTNPPRRKSDRLRSPGSPGRKSNRINSPETNRRQSSRINSLEPNRRQSNRINSPETNRRQSSRINSLEPNRRSNRINSPEPNRRSNRINSPEPNRRSNRINSPETNKRSNRINSPEPNRRQSNRINSPQRNRHQSNRNMSPLDRDNSTDSSDSTPVQLNKRKSNRINSPEKRHFNRIKSTIISNGNSRKTKIQNSNSLSESRRKDRSDSPEFRSNSQRKSSRKAETANLGASSQEKQIRDNSKSVKPRTRKLFNPKKIL